MKRDSKYMCLSSKEDVKNVVRKIRRNKMKKERDDDLEELSIEEEIMVENVDEREHHNPTLTILTSISSPSFSSLRASSTFSREISPALR